MAGMAICLSIASAGCNIFASKPGGREVGKSGDAITAAELYKVARATADRYVTVIADAADAIAAGNPSADERALVKYIRVLTFTSVYDIVTTPDPVEEVIDLAVSAELDYIVWVEEGQALRLFGEERGPRLIRPLTEMRKEIWVLADRFLKPSDRSALEQLIRTWRRANPEVRLVAFVRFRDLAFLPAGESLFASVQKAFSTNLVLGSISDTAEKSRILGERAFFYSKRLPLLLHWEADALLAQLAAHPEIGRTMEAFVGAKESIARVSATLERLAGPEAEGELRATAKEIQATLAEGRETAGGVREAIAAAEALVAGFRPVTGTAAPAGKRFDIDDYTAAFTALGKTAEELDAALKEARTLVASPAWSARMADVKRATDAAADHGAWRAAEVILLFFALLAVYALATTWMRAPGGRDGAARSGAKPAPAAG